MSEKTNFGGTLTSGIQDVSALLPLLGTEQCERHVGSALEKGFLYAGVTPISIFGSLGVVKTSFATLLATLTFPFYGSRWLNDAGFGTPGSVSSMATIATGSVEYGAEANLIRLFKDQHIDDLDLVEDVEWSGWQKPTESQSDSPSNLPSRPWWMSWWMSISWNVKLVITSALAALISVSPYLYLMSPDWVDPLFWFFPLLRALGSFLCVVAIQLALQLRIHHVIRGRLLLMKVTKTYQRANATQTKNLPDWDDEEDILEQRLRKLSKHHDSESEKRVGGQIFDQKLNEILSISWLLIAYQLIMVAGIPMIVVGYVGCFNLVGQSKAIGGPYVWLGTEAMLSVLRLALWGWNPKWNEGTGMKIKLKLQLSDGVPLITTPYSLSELKPDPRLREKHGKYSFIIINENDFLAAATRFTGPLQRFVSSTFSLFYSLVSDNKRQFRLLFTTVLDLRTRTTQTFYIDKEGLSKVFSSTWKLDPRTNAMRVTLDKEIKWDESRQDDVFNQVLDHSKHIASRLYGSGRINALDLQWTVTYLSPKSDLSLSEIAMDDRERKYVGFGNQSINKSSFCRKRDGWIRDYVNRWQAIWSPNEWAELDRGIEMLHLLESTVLEMYLHSKVQALAQELASRDGDRLFAEWMHEMECRMSEGKKSSMERFDKWKMQDDDKQGMTWMWEIAPEVLGWRRELDLSKIVTVLDRGGATEFTRTILPWPFYDDWPFNSTSERVRRTIDSQVRWFARRFKAVLQDGFPSGDTFPLVNYAEDPYLSVDHASPYVLDAIRLNSSLRVIRLSYWPKLSTSDIKNILDVVADKDTLTTVDIDPKYTLSDDILENNNHILFLPRVTCEQPCIKHSLCALVHRNQQEWKDRARSTGSDVTYAVGFTNSESSRTFLRGDEVHLSRDAECLIMVYTQSSRRLKLSLHHRGYRNPTLHIFLRSGEMVNEWQEMHSISAEDIPEQYADKPHEIVIPEVAAGYHEIRIQMYGYYLHSATVTRCESDNSRSENV